MKPIKGVELFTFCNNVEAKLRDQSKAFSIFIFDGMAFENQDNGINKKNGHAMLGNYKGI